MNFIVKSNVMKEKIPNALYCYLIYCLSNDTDIKVRGEGFNKFKSYKNIFQENQIQFESFCKP